MNCRLSQFGLKQFSLALLLAALTTGRALAADAAGWQAHLDHAQAAKMAGKWDEAETEYKDALALLEKTAGQNQKELAKTMSDLALVYARKRKFDESVDLLKRELEIVKTLPDQDQSDLVIKYQALAVINRQRGNNAEAIEYFKQALKVAQEKMGKDSLKATNLMAEIAVTCMASDDHVQAAQYAKSALDAFEAAKGADADETVNLACILYTQYLSLDKLAEARALLPKYIQARTKTKGEKDLLVQKMRTVLPMSLEPVKPKPVKPSALKFLSEEEWMVDFVGRDITEMLIFAANKNKGEFQAGEISFQTKAIDRVKGTYQYFYGDKLAALNGQYQFTIANYLWAPQNYIPLATQLLSQLKLSPAAVSEAPKDFIAKLADGDMKVLILESERVSDAITKQPLDAGLHEQAAMLIAKLNMEECANAFTEDRPQFARGCAHLSIARALNGGKLSQVGELAEVALELMTARDGMVEERLEALYKSSQDREFLSFVRALKMRATSDLRTFNEKDPTAVEAGQYVMRLGPERHGDASLEYVMGKISDPQMYFFRVLSVCVGSVEGGHSILSKIVPMELNSFVEDYNVFKNKKVESAYEIADQLNLTPTRALYQAEGQRPVLQAISWDDIAAFHGRHLLGAISSEYYYYDHLYGVKEAAKKTEERAKKYFGDMTLFPCLQAEFDYSVEEKDGKHIKDPKREKEAKEVVARCNELELNRPEQVTSACWSTIKRMANTYAPDAVLRKGSSWFEPAVPRGTAFFYYARREFGNVKDDLATLTEIRKYCPYHYEINIDWVRKKYGDYPTSEQYAEAFGKMKEYNVKAQELVAYGNVDDADKFAAQKLELAKKDPHSLFDLANYMATRGRPEEAKTYYERALAENDDAVMNANHSEWLVFYYLGKGEKAKAKALATQAYHVYSERGLDTMAKFYERTGDVKKAEEIYLESKERYEHTRELTAFYIRNADKNPEWKKKAEEMSKEAYPAGLRTVNLDDFKGPPKTGMRVKWGDPYLRNSPITKDVIIVALNGYPVDNMTQYYLAKEVTPNGTIKAIFWDPNSKSYKEGEKKTVQDNLLQIQIEEYKPGKKKELSND